MKVDLYNQKGEKTEKVELKKEVFGVEVNDKVLSQYVYSYLANQRESNAHTKTRAEVSGGGKKPWRQKGTGRARFGSTRNPIWTKGGVAFGPRSDRNWKKAMTKKFKLAALRNALSLAVKEDNFRVIETFDIDTKKPLTKQATDMIKALGNPKKFTIITANVNKDVVNAFSNIEKANVTFTGELNSYDILTGGVIIVEKSAIDVITSKFKETKK